MWNRKKQESGELEEEESYQFMREQVRPQKKRRTVQFLQRMAGIAAAAAVFGVIAGGVIVFIQGRFREGEQAVVEITTYSPMETEAPTPTPDTSTAKRITKRELTLSDYEKLSQKLSAVGTDMKSAIVGVKSKATAKNWFEQNTSVQSTSFGLIFREGKSYYDILTTADVVEDQSEVNVVLSDDTVVESSILGSDTKLGVAVVRMKKESIDKTMQESITVASFGTGLGLSDGTHIVAVGCPNGVLYSVIGGVITNDSIQASITDGEVQLYCTDIPYCESGNGVVLDTEGRAVGVITTGFSSDTGKTGMAFIKISDVTTILELLQKKISVPYMGMEGKDINTATAEAHKLEEGVYVTEVYSGSPAYEGGLRVADVITKMDGEIVSGMSDVYAKLLVHRTGDTVVCTVSRKSGNKKVTKKLKIKLG
jgi:serine protease Do